MSKQVRVGIVGAGAIARQRHIPGLRQQAGVEIVAVANRTAESTAAAAKEFGIPKTFARWEELVASPDIDAVVIGAWPNSHCEMTCAALAAGKHVLCEARMSRDLAEARRMLDASRARPELVAQLVPSPFGLTCGPIVKEMVKSHFLGDLREVVVLGVTNQFWDYSRPLHWRQDAEISGKNVLTLGILHETLLRWAPPPVQVFAQTELFEPTRPSPENGTYIQASVPDSVQILAELQGGARAIYHFSGISLFGPGHQIHLYGSRGTLKVEFANGAEKVWAARAEDTELRAIELPEADQGRWRVEEDFIAAIRGERKVELTDFATGVKYMEFIEAVARSAEANEPVEMPLES